MKQMSKRLLALLLCTVLVLSQLPGTVWAEEEGILSSSLAGEEVIPASDLEGGEVIPPSEPAEGEIPASDPADDEVIPSDDLAEDEVAPSDNVVEEELITVSSLAAGEVIAISNEAQLRAITDMTGDYKLTGDIALTEEWIPFGSSTTPFTGTFDGDGYTISGLSINAENSTYQGLFGRVGLGGIVQNLVVQGTIGSNSTTNAFIGGIVGGMTGGSVVNCISKVTINAVNAKKVGGVIGDATTADSEIEVIGCANLGSVKAASMAGGVIGSAKNTIVQNCYNVGAVTTSSSNCGGVVGYTQGTVRIKGCYNADTGTRSGTNSGAVVGFLNSASTADNCYWLEKESTVGIGNASGGYAGTIKACSSKPEEELKQSGILNILNQGAPDGSRFVSDTGNLNNGYPVLECQLPKVERYEVTFDLTPADATLTVKDSNGVTQTGAKGVYRLAAGQYNYSASAFGYKSIENFNFSVVDEEAPGTVTVDLKENDRQTVTFSGLPEGAKLTVSHAVAGQIMPDADGIYHLPAGDYTYTVVSKGYAPLVDQSFTVTGGPVSETVSMTALGSAQPWDGTTKTPVTTIGKTYYIQNGTELAWFANETINGRLLDARVVLLADINLGDKPWSSISPYGKLFAGKFDGNGCVVSGLAGECYGLFYGIAAGGTVENLTVSGSINGTSNIGGIAGVNYGTIRNCASNVTVSVTEQRAGGIVGLNYSGGIISGCAALAPVGSSYKSFANTVNIGGIAGQNSGSVESSYSAAMVTATGQNHNGGVGGIAGASTGNIKNCYSAGTVSYAAFPDKSVGAIAGTIANEPASGTVQNSFYLAGSCAKGVGTGSTDGVQAKTGTEMKKYPLVILLNEGSADGPFYLASSELQNSGYPVLKWQGGKIPQATPEELAVAADKTALSLGRPVYTEAGKITLPESGASGSTITWKSSMPEVINDTGVVTLPTEQSTVKVVLTATLTKGDVQDTKEFTITVYSAAQVSLNYLAEAKASLGLILAPVYGRDKNIVNMAEELLADRGFGDVSVGLKDPGSLSVGEGTHITEDGAITYFYRDPASSGMNVAIVRGISFTLSKAGQSIDWDNVQANIPWDRAKVLKTLQDEVATNLNWAVIKNNNSSPKEITTALTLPIKLDNAKWATITWESDSSVIFPEDYAPGADETTGRVFRLSVDAQVNLTAVIRFNLTTANEPDISLEVPFDLVVLGSEGADTPEKMQKKLESYTLEKLTDSITKLQLDPAAVKGDIQFPTPAKTGIADSSAYRFTVSSKDASVMEVTGYRGYIYRPLPGKEPAKAAFTVTMTNRANPTLSVSKDMEVTVLPLEQSEIDEAIRLMEAVRADYSRAILGTNTDKNAITADLSTFRETVFGSDGQSLVYSRKISDDTGRGIVVDDLPGSGPDGPGYELWRTFKTSRPDILAHEVLRLTKPTYDTTVTVESCLTHEILGKYALKHPGNRDFESLYQVSIVEPFIVKGTSGEVNPNPDKTFSATFSLNAKGLIENISAVSVGNLKSGTTVFDVFKKVLADKGFSYEAKGGYVSAVTDSKYVRLAEFDKGENSGWMYKVDGEFPDKMMNAYYLSGGEVIEFLYTGDWKTEDGVKGGMASEVRSGTILKPVATVSKNGEAKAEVSSKDMEAAVAAAKKDSATNIIIEPEIKGDVSKVTVTIPKESLASIVKNTSAKLTLKTAAGDVSISNSAFSELAKKSGEAMAISVETVKDANDKLTGEIKIDVKIGGNSVGSIKGGLTVSLNADKPTAGTVLMIVTNEGMKIVKKSLVDGKTLSALLEGPATVIVKDNSKTFDDVPDGYWGKDAVVFAASHELFQGTGATAFNPNGTMTRSMLVTVLHRLENEAAPARNAVFTDVDQAAWYSNAADWAAASGIVNGTGTGFDPDGSISREQLAAMLYRYAKLSGANPVAVDSAVKKFTDAGSVSPWATEAMGWAVNSGLITGRSSDTLAPGATATRAEVAAIFQRFISALLK